MKSIDAAAQNIKPYESKWIWDAQTPLGMVRQGVITGEQGLVLTLLLLQVEDFIKGKRIAREWLEERDGQFDFFCEFLRLAPEYMRRKFLAKEIRKMRKKGGGHSVQLHHWLRHRLAYVPGA